MDTTCEICRHTTAAGRYLCEACEYRAGSWLTGLPRQVELLQQFLAPAAGPAQRGGTGRAHSPLPVDVRVLDLLGPGQVAPIEDPHGDQSAGIPLEPLIYGWARYLASEIPVVRHDEHGTARIEYGTEPASRRGAPCLTTWCAWLQTYLPYAVTRPWAAVLYEQLQDAMDRIQRITHARPQRRRRQAPCPDCTAFALMEQDGEFHISCEACGRRMTPDEYTAHRDQVMPALTALALRMITPRTAAA